MEKVETVAKKKKKKHMSDGIERRHFKVRILESGKCG